MGRRVMALVCAGAVGVIIWGVVELVIWSLVDPEMDFRETDEPCLIAAVLMRAYGECTRRSAARGSSKCVEWDRCLVNFRYIFRT